MKAAVLHGAHDITVEEVPYPELEPDGVIVKVKACGICGSDLHGYRHSRRPGDRISGHELSGDVVEVGSDVTGVKEGDRVVAIGGKSCGECYWCREGTYTRCSKLRFIGGGVPGAFAEYVQIPQFKLGLYAAKLPDGLSYEEGATVEPLAVSLHAVNQVEPQPGDTVVVTGLGILGIFAIQILKSIGVKQIIASGRRAKRLELAKQSGADVVVDATKDDIVPVAEEATRGKGVDIVIECAGATPTFHQALQMVHRGGKIDLVGLYQEPISWNPSSIVGRDISLFGCGLRWNLPGAVALLQNGKANARPLITHQFRLDRVKEAFDTQLEAQDAIKVLVKP